MKMATVLFLAMMTVPSMLTVPAAAATDPQQAAADLSNEIMSPFCDGVTLHDCPSQAALDLRDRIASWFADGASRGEIMQRLEDEYGPQVRALPEREGSGLLAWILPVAALALGATVAFLVARRFTSRPAPPTKPLSADEKARLDAELRTLREGA